MRELEKTRNEVGLLAAEKNSKIISLNTALAQMDVIMIITIIKDCLKCS